MEMILFIGIPGSGKSTFYKQYFFNSHLRISLDLIRTRNRERRLLDFCYKTSMPFVLDNTNVTIEDRRGYIQTAKNNRYRVRGYCFNSDLEQCLDRNQLRPDKERVPLAGIYSKRKILQFPTIEEGFEQLLYVEVVGDKFVLSENGSCFEE